MLKLGRTQFATVLESLQRSAALLSGEHRSATRMQVQTQLTIALLRRDSVEPCFTCLSRDLSFTGIGLLQSIAVTKGDDFLLCLPLGKEEVIVTCSVAFCSEVADGIFDVGATYLELTPPELAFHVSRRRLDDIERIRRSILT